MAQPSARGAPRPPLPVAPAVPTFALSRPARAIWAVTAASDAKSHSDHAGVTTRTREDEGAMDIQELLGKISENLSVRRAFGAAYERDGALIIPVALVLGGGGGGEGPMRSAPADPLPAVETAQAVTSAVPDGQPLVSTGGGFGGVVLPLGIYVAKGDQVRWVPAYDVTLIVLASLGVVRALLRLVRNSRRGGT
jgi:uncharacterized spore protein YtfJ